MIYRLVFKLVLLSVLLNTQLFAVSESTRALKNKMVFKNPPIEKLNRTEALNAWGVSLFANGVSVGYGYTMTPAYELLSATSFQLDNTLNRIIYQESLSNWMRAYGSHGSLENNFSYPRAIDAQALCNSTGYTDYYFIYVADATNKRIVNLRYNWRTSDIAWLGSISHPELKSPIDIELNNGGTFLANSDDYLWVVDRCSIKRFTFDGVLQNSYGANGTGEGKFSRPSAVACGRSYLPNGSSEAFANNNYIYVADKGNNRIVWLEKDPYSEAIIWKGEVAASNRIYDLEVDNFGQVWAIDFSGMQVIKYTYDLFPLCTFGSPGVGENKLYRPIDIFNVGGYLGGGNIGITESWTDSTGFQYFSIGTDVLDFDIQSSSDSMFHYIYYTLIDPSIIKIQIHDIQGKSVAKDLYHGAVMSGPCFHVWDGTNNDGIQVESGWYNVIGWDTCSYRSIDPDDSVITELTFGGYWFFHRKNTSSIYIPGDVNADGNVNIGDAVYLINYIFKGGPPPQPVLCVGDVNDDGSVNIGDAVHMINYVFKGGTAPNNGCVKSGQVP